MDSLVHSHHPASYRSPGSAKISGVFSARASARLLEMVRPLLHMSMVGRRRLAHETPGLPYRFLASNRPRISPGTAAARGPEVKVFRSAWTFGEFSRFNDAIPVI